MEIGWPDAERLSAGRLLSLLGRTTTMPHGTVCPVSGNILLVARMVQGAWAHHSQVLCSSLDSHTSLSCQMQPLGLHHARSGSACHVLGPLEGDLGLRLLASASALSVAHISRANAPVNNGPDPSGCDRSSCSGQARFWCFARWSHDPVTCCRFLGHTWTSRNQQSLRCSRVGAHCLSDLTMLVDIPHKWCHRCGLSWQSGAERVGHPWIFGLSSLLNYAGLVRAHFRVLGEVCERLPSSTE